MYLLRPQHLGTLVEDVLHLTTEEHHKESVVAYITFGCGQVQTGSFLDVAAPNGLFGLGMEKISVPSVLSREGFTTDSFCMCFGQDGVGRIRFGDKGSPHQRETPFNVNPLQLVVTRGVLPSWMAMKKIFSGQRRLQGKSHKLGESMVSSLRGTRA